MPGGEKAAAPVVGSTATHILWSRISLVTDCSNLSRTEPLLWKLGSLATSLGPGRINLYLVTQIVRQVKGKLEKQEKPSELFSVLGDSGSDSWTNPVTGLLKTHVGDEERGWPLVLDTNFILWDRGRSVMVMNAAGSKQGALWEVNAYPFHSRATLIYSHTYIDSAFIECLLCAWHFVHPTLCILYVQPYGMKAVLFPIYRWGVCDSSNLVVSYKLYVK